MKHTVKICLAIFTASAALWALPPQQALPEPPSGAETVRVFPGGQEQAWLGVELQDVTASKVKELNLPGEYGAIVARVSGNSPAAKAGLEANDVILEFAGMRVWSAGQLRQLVGETPPGRDVNLLISRNGRKLDLHATLAARTQPPFAFSLRSPRVNFPRSFDFRLAPSQGRLGIEGETLSSQLASFFGVKQGKGVLVTEVEAGSPAEKAGLKAGDCIVRAGSIEIDSVSSLLRALGAAGPGEQLMTFTIVRDKHQQTVHAQLRAPGRLIPEFEGQEIQRRVQQEMQSIQRQIPHIEQMEKQLEQRLQTLRARLNSQAT